MSIEPGRRSDDGFTLIELIIFIVIVSVGLVGILSVLNVTVRGSADPMIRKQMLAVAEGLLEEVSLMPFTYCDPDDPSATTASLSGGAIVGCGTQEDIGPEAGESRGATTTFDNVNDYYVAGGLLLDPLTNIVGNSNPNLNGYTATINIIPEPLNGVGSPSLSATTMEALRIAVTVTHGNETLLLEGYRTRHSPNFVP